MRGLRGRAPAHQTAEARVHVTPALLHRQLLEHGRHLADLTRAAEACAERLDTLWSGPGMPLEAEPDLSLEPDAIAGAAAHLTQEARALSDCALKAAQLAAVFGAIALLAEHVPPPAGRAARAR